MYLRVYIQYIYNVIAEHAYRHTDICHALSGPRICVIMPDYCLAVVMRVLACINYELTTRTWPW